MIKRLIVAWRIIKMYILPHSPKCSPSQPKTLKYASELLFAFEQTKQNPSDILYFIASKK